MAKKEFKSGLDSLLEETLKKHGKEMPINTPKKQAKNQPKISNKTETKDETSQSNQDINILKSRLLAYEEELRLWRSGKLDVQKFEESLKAHKLNYNKQSNQIEEP